jgi:hypothetical protein
MQMQQRPAPKPGCNECAYRYCVYAANVRRVTEDESNERLPPTMANSVSQTMTHSGLGMGLHIVPQCPLRIFASLTPMYASLLAGLPTVTDHVFSP